MNYRIVEINSPNVRNNHIYLAKIIDFFPSDAVGGSSKNALASALLELHYGLGDPVRTDIAGDKKIFRSRAWVSDFVQAHNLGPGSKIVIQQTGSYRYHIYPAR